MTSNFFFNEVIRKFLILFGFRYQKLFVIICPILKQVYTKIVNSPD